MKKNIILLLSFVLIISCYNNKKPKEIKDCCCGYHEFVDDDSIIIKYKKDKEGKPHGKFCEYYITGELHRIDFYSHGDLSSKDTIYVYYKNGKIKEKGLYIDDCKQGWWSYYDSLGNLIVKVDELTIDSIRYRNQFLKYKNNKLDTTESYYYKIILDDTISFGKNLVKIYYFSPYKKSKKFLLGTINSDDIKTEKDTVYTFGDTLFFDIMPVRTGDIDLKGYIFEEYFDDKIIPIGNDSVKLLYITDRMLFNKKIFVKSN